ncbi:MAG: aminoacyl-tRNA deacylase [Deltaproteobacteria bacterium]|nr:aminoacyl-tRNA deacylase [Deltaproteobacteria bacterium]
MPPRTAKTNAVRLLEGEGVPFDLLEAPVDEGDLSAEKAAADLNLPPETVYKTLVAKGDRGGYVKAMLPAGRRLDLKALAAASGDKSAAMIPVKDILAVTGYVRGGCSPLGGKLRSAVYILDEAVLHERIVFNAGKRGLFIRMSPEDFIRITGAIPCPLACPEEGGG